MNQASVLVVEDERIVALGIEKRLVALGYAVVGRAATGEDAILMAADLRPDVVLMDINLGAGIDGVAAADAIRKAQDTPVVFLTAHSDEATLGRARLTLPFGYVVKPYDDTDLHIALQIGLERHRADRRIRENEQWLAATLGSIGDGVIATDEQGRVRFLNGVASQLTGWSPLDAVGADVTAVFNAVSERTREAVPNPVREAISTGRSAELARNTALIARDGSERPIDDSAAPIRDSSGRVSGGVLVFRDITERRRLEEHLRQAQKMEAVGRLAGGIAHDFNNIMTVMMGFSEMLLADRVPPGEVKSTLHHIHDAGKRATLLTRQILAFSRKQTLMPAVLSLNAVVRDMAEMVRRLIGSDVEFSTEPGEDLAHAEVDPTQVGQIILNMAANARDAMPDGGRFVIATGNATLGPEVARLFPDVKPGKYAMMSFADTGCGMPPEVAARAFEPFFTTKETGQGTGLGLASVHGIVKQSGGHVEVESAVGKGTTFRAYFPAVAPPAGRGAGAAAYRGARGTETVLLVEDDEIVRGLARTVLAGAGYTVLEAMTGAAGLVVAARHAGRIHLLMTDLVMPGMKGTALADRLRATRPETRVLFVSGYNEESVALRGLDVSAVNFLQKPFSIDGLLTAVRVALDRA